MPGQLHSQPSPTSLGQGCMGVFRCNLPPALLAEWSGSFTYHCGNMRMEHKVTLEKKMIPPILSRFELVERRTRDQKATSSNPGRSSGSIFFSSVTLYISSYPGFPVSQVC